MSDDLDSLDVVFELPEEIASNPKLALMYEVLVARMRREAVNLPLNTVHQLLIERIAFNYIVLRQKERGELGGFNHSTAQKDFNTFWLSMTQELNKKHTCLRGEAPGKASQNYARYCNEHLIHN